MENGHSLPRQLFRYYVSGATGAAIDFSLFSVLVLYSSLGFIISNVISFGLGTAVVCYLQKTWTFRFSGDNPANLYSRYLLSIGIIFCVNNLLLVLFISILHCGEVPGKILQIFASSLLGYGIQRWYVFSSRRLSDR